MSIGGSSYLGDDRGSIGAATVDGAGSNWTSGGNLSIGNSGNGTLTIRNGGVVSNTLAMSALIPGRSAR